ncbi:hypothetical protein I4U23_031253 [Adineta vaga]|nr:hypothetical protein I4U23_031253 [Adineta vaga]
MNSKTNSKKSRILNHSQFKSKKKRVVSNFFKENFFSNWIQNEYENQSFSSRNSQIKNQTDDQDSLQLNNLEYLSTMKYILFLDLENFSNFFQHLTNPLPNQIYILAFTSLNYQWKPPLKNVIYENLIQSNSFQLMNPSGNRHDAADFALVLTFGKLHGLLPKSISFTIISGDKGFLEIIHQLKTSQRKINWFNPHLISLENFNQIFQF